MQIRELHYSNTNTYLIEGGNGKVLFDTGWAGTFPAFCQAMGAAEIPVQEVTHILISHFHPDHMGIVQEIADQGAVILAADVQKDHIHAADAVFAKEKGNRFVPIKEEKVRFFRLADSRNVLSEIGISGCILHTPGHSDDSISLMLDSGELFVGDLNPLYELELHKGTQIGESWERLLELHPKKVYYGHAKMAELTKVSNESAQKNGKENADALKEDSGKSFALVEEIVKLIRKNGDVKRICKKTGADPAFVQDVMRMYLTHTNISIQGILDRIEIKDR